MDEYKVPAKQPSPTQEDRKIILATDRNPWEQQPDEADKLYARFQIYMALGMGRSIAKAYNAITGKSETQAAWETMAVRWRWFERAGAYDVSISSKLVEKYQGSMKNFQSNLMRFLEVVSADALEAVEKKDLNFLKKIAPTHMSLIGKGNTGNFLLNGHKQLFGEKQQVQQSITVEWDPIEPEPKTIDITDAKSQSQSHIVELGEERSQRQPPENTKKAKLHSNALAHRKVDGAGGFVEFKD